MKNIIVGPAFPLRGGIANFNIALASAFQKAGIETKIMSFSLQYPGFLFPGKTQYEEGNAPENIKITQDINSVNPISWIHTAWKIYKEKPDYLVIAYWMPFMAPALGTIAWIAKRCNIKVIAIAHNIIPHESHFYDSVLTKYFVNSCNGYITLAKSVLEDLSKFTENPNKKFIPHPIYDIFGPKADKSDALRYLNLQENKRYLLFFGLIRHYKGLDILLKALAIKKVRELNITLLIAGEFYEDKSFYEKIIHENELNSNVIITDNFIPGEDVKYYFAVADMVVQPYHTATQSGVTQIAYHFERPMLVTNVGGLAEIVPHNIVGYVTETTPESIADYICDFYTNNREQIFTNNVASEKVKFSWESMVTGITELMHQIDQTIET